MKHRTTLNQDKQNENNDIGGLKNNPLRLNSDAEIKNSSHHHCQCLHRIVWIWRRRKGGVASCVVVCGGEEVRRREKGEREEQRLFQSMIQRQNIIKFVVQTIPTYCMNVFVLPNSLGAEMKCMLVFVLLGFHGNIQGIQYTSKIISQIFEF